MTEIPHIYLSSYGYYVVDFHNQDDLIKMIEGSSTMVFQGRNHSNNKSIWSLSNKEMSYYFEMESIDKGYEFTKLVIDFTSWFHVGNDVKKFIEDKGWKSTTCPDTNDTILTMGQPTPSNGHCWHEKKTYIGLLGLRPFDYCGKCDARLS